MRTASILKVACAAGLAAACLCTAAGCSSDGAAEGLTGGVAATVNGVEIQEDDVTTMIQQIRSSNNLDDDDTWGMYLASGGMTPEDVRQNIIDSYVDQELMKQGAEDRGVTVEDSEVDSYVESIKSNYDSDEKWNQALQGAGFEDEAAYRENVKNGLLSSKLMESFEVDDPTDEEVLEYAATAVSNYDGAKKSSHILFDANDKDTAQSVLDQIDSGELDFAEAAKEYSTDTASAADGGNVGWDKLTTFVDAYQDALDSLEVGQVSGLVESDYGYHIIKCTDEFTAPAEVTSLDQIPQEFVDTFKSYVKTQKQSDAYQTWFEEFKAESDIVVNDMPEGLPYAVDMSAYESDDSEGEASDASDASDGSADGAADGSAEQGSDAAADDASSDGASDGSSDEASDGASADKGEADAAA